MQQNFVHNEDRTMVKCKKKTSRKKRYKQKRYSKRDDVANQVMRATAMDIKGKCNVTCNLQF